MAATASSSRARTGMVVLCQHGIGDPLIAPLMLDYVLRLAAEDPDLDTLFITEEPPGGVVPEGIMARLDAARVRWLPLRYDVRGRQWVQRAGNLVRMVLGARSFLAPYRKRWLVGYLSYGGSYAVIANALGLGPCAVVCFEPHSRYMIELGLWGRRSMKARITQWLERAQMRRSAVIVVPTVAVREEVVACRGHGRGVVLQPIAIDVRRALADSGARAAIRGRYGWGDDLVLAYVGKLGGIYHSPEAYIRFVERVSEADPRARFLIISQPTVLSHLQAHAGFPAVAHRTTLIEPVPPEELHRYLSAADLGVIAIPPTPSQAFRTPVKTAHYWAAGLPIIIPRGVSDDHSIAEEEDVGIVVNDLPTADRAMLKAAFDRFRNEDRAVVRERCIAAAMRYRDTRAMVRVLHRSLLVPGAATQRRT